MHLGIGGVGGGCGRWAMVMGTRLNRFASVEDDARGVEIRMAPVERSRRRGAEKRREKKK